MELSLHPEFDCISILTYPDLMLVASLLCPQFSVNCQLGHNLTMPQEAPPPCESESADIRSKPSSLRLVNILSLKIARGRCWAFRRIEIGTDTFSLCRNDRLRRRAGGEDISRTERRERPDVVAQHTGSREDSDCASRLANQFTRSRRP